MTLYSNCFCNEAIKSVVLFPAHDGRWPPFRYIFCAQSEKSVKMSRGTGSLRVASQGLSCLFLKLSSAVYPDPASRPYTEHVRTTLGAYQNDDLMKMSHFVANLNGLFDATLDIIMFGCFSQPRLLIAN